eukprot:2834418-Amphidinium_carterae.1
MKPHPRTVCPFSVITHAHRLVALILSWMLVYVQPIMHSYEYLGSSAVLVVVFRSILVLAAGNAGASQELNTP